MPNSIFLRDPSGLGQLPNGKATPIYRPLADEYGTSHGTNAHGLDNDAPIDGDDVGYGDSADTLTEAPYSGPGVPLEALAPPVPLMVSIVPQPMKTVRKQTIITDLLPADLVGVSQVVGTVDTRNMRTISPDNKRVSARLVPSLVNVTTNFWAFAVATDRSFSNFVLVDQYTLSGNGGLDLDGTSTFFIAPYIVAASAGVPNNLKLSVLYYLESIPLDGDSR